MHRCNPDDTAPYNAMCPVVPWQREMEPLSLHQVEALMRLGPEAYCTRVITLFSTRRATPAQWTAMAEALFRCHDYHARGLEHRLRTATASPGDYRTMAEAVLTVSESSEGALVAVIDQAVLTPCPLCGEHCEAFAQAGEEATL